MAIITNTFTVDKPAWVDTVVSAEAVKIVVDGKYKQYKRGEFAKDSQVHEYVRPDGVGFLLIEYKTLVDGEWFRVGGIGPDSSQYHDWIPYNRPDGYGV